MSKCSEPNIFTDMVAVLKEKVGDHSLRMEIYKEVIIILETGGLVSDCHFMLGEDTAFDEVYKKLKKDKLEK